MPPTYKTKRKKELGTAAEVNEKFNKWRNSRRTHEIQWFINHSFVRGQQYVQYNEVEQKVSQDQQPSHRIRLTINRILPKVRSRIAKFLKNRPSPVIVPATTERQDILDARLTQKVLDYLWRKLDLESKYRDALMWSAVAGKGFWWFYWDGTKEVPVQLEDELTGQMVTQTGQLGDVCVEVGNPFEILVADLSCARLQDQPEIMRVKIRPIDEIRARYNNKKLEADAGYSEVFHYEKRIAELTSRGWGAGIDDSYKGGGGGDKEPQTHITVKELFVRPCANYPQGRYVVVAGETMVKDEEQLPYQMSDMDNPYPVVEFTDLVGIGQYWGTTMVEQLIGLQKEYNLTRSKIAEQLRLMAFPKILVAKQHQLPDGAYDSEAGEIIEYIALPSIPPPTIIPPQPISSDAWRSLDLMREEFDTTTQIYPVSEGQVGGTKSGFQTSLLQEATDSVHAPDIRGHEISIEQAMLKLRRLMKLYYDTGRLIRITTPNAAPEIFEFSNSQIDEYADVIVQAGSGLPTLKAAKIQSALELWDRGILGNPQDPEVRRKVMSLLDMGGLEEVYETTQRHEELARLENLYIEEEKPVEPPQFYQDHQVHYSIHADQLNMPETLDWPPEKRLKLLIHTIQTVFFFDPQGAYRLTQQYGLTGLIPEPAPPEPPPGMMPPPGAPPMGPPPMGDPNAPPMGSPPMGPPPPSMMPPMDPNMMPPPQGAVAQLPLGPIPGIPPGMPMPIDPALLQGQPPVGPGQAPLL